MLGGVIEPTVSPCRTLGNLVEPVRKTFMRFAVLVCLALGACADDSHDPGDDEPVNCAEVTDDDDFAVGLSKVGSAGALGFTLMTADPAPPIRGDNTWVIQINQMSGGVAGAPVDGADMTATPFMPQHQHPSGKTVVIEPTGTAGQYELTPINFWMPGVWETTLDAVTPSGDDAVVFRFCIPS